MKVLESREKKFCKENLFRLALSKRNLLVTASDFLILLVSAFVAALIVSDFQSGLVLSLKGLVAVAFTAVVKLVGLEFLRFNKRSLRFFSLGDAYYLAQSVFFLSLLSALVLFFLPEIRFYQVASFFVIDALFSFFSLGAVRGGFRLCYEKWFMVKPVDQPQLKRVLILGAGKAGVALQRHLKSEQLRLEGFLDDDRAKQGMRIGGVPILGTISDLSWVVRTHNINEAYIAMPSAKKAELKRITEICLAAKVKFKTIPSLKEILDMKSQVSALRDVRVEDLLGREPVQLDKSQTLAEIRDQVVLVTGAGGSIGSELCRQIMSFGPKKLILLERSEYNLFFVEKELQKKYPSERILALVGDIMDRDELERIFSTYRPSIVYHAAAYKHVPLMEARPREAVKNNIFGTRNLAEVASKYAVNKFVMISTDKAVRPVSIMGFSKRLAEIVVQYYSKQSSTKFMSVRFGNVLGSSGSVVEIFRRQLKEGGPLTVTHPEVRRYFMTTPEAVELVLHAGSHGQNGAIYMLEMGEAVKIMDLANKMIQLADPEGLRQIKVQVTGLRPGEKMTEELLWEGESLVASGIEAVAMLQNHVSVANVDSYLRALEECIQSSTCDIGHELKSIVNSIDRIKTNELKIPDQIVSINSLVSPESIPVATPAVAIGRFAN